MGEHDGGGASYSSGGPQPTYSRVEERKITSLATPKGRLMSALTAKIHQVVPAAYPGHQPKTLLRLADDDVGMVPVLADIDQQGWRFLLRYQSELTVRSSAKMVSHNAGQSTAYSDDNAAGAVPNVKLKHAPSPSTDSAHTRPPWRPTILRTLAKPIPVPGNSDSLCRR